ncbi:MAG: hypothetical protein RLW62_09990 [Gammaproteobacteria bacterium]
MPAYRRLLPPACLAAVIVSAAAGMAPSTAAQPSARPPPPPEVRLAATPFAALDSNDSGFIEGREEEATALMSRIHFAQMDTDDDERVSAREFATWQERLREARARDATPGRR